MKHLENLKTEVNGKKKGLVQRSAGRFYTPHWMAKQLACETLKHATGLKGRIRLIDPFCGDGRLVVACVEELAKSERLRKSQIQIELWDNDKNGLDSAVEFVREALVSAKLSGTVVSHNWDSLLESSTKFGVFDLVLTNPPWESIKPDIRELHQLSSDEQIVFIDGLRHYDKQLAIHLPNSQPVKKMYGWGTNLSRCGLELSLNLLDPTGCCGIILPSSLLSDQISSDLRKWFLTQVNLKTIDHFPAEAKPFDGVDQPCVMTVFERKMNYGPIQPTIITRYDRNRELLGREKYKLSLSDLSEMDYRIPVELSAAELLLLQRLSRYRPLSDWEISNGGNLWIGRELDETNYRSFVSESGEFAFIKGRNVHRYKSIGAAAEFIKSGLFEMPKSVTHQRIAWRDISRRSQNRRMCASIIPSGTVTGNSLHVGYFSDDSKKRLRALLGIFNSLVFEFQLRARLGTGHISLGSLRGVRVPNLGDYVLIDRLSECVERAMSGEVSGEIDIEVLLADAFSLSKAERATLIAHFAGLPDLFIIELKEKLDTVENQIPETEIRDIYYSNSESHRRKAECA